MSERVGVEGECEKEVVESERRESGRGRERGWRVGERESGRKVVGVGEWEGKAYRDFLIP